MDPNAAVQALNAATDRIMAIQDGIVADDRALTLAEAEELGGLAEEVAEHWRALNGWLSARGFSPEDWQSATEPGPGKWIIQMWHEASFVHQTAGWHDTTWESASRYGTVPAGTERGYDVSSEKSARAQMKRIVAAFPENRYRLIFRDGTEKGYAQ